MTSLLKPFNWVNPVIFSVPSRHYLLLNSPVPIVAGVLAERNFFEQYIKPEISSEYETASYAIVYLDEYHHQIKHAHQMKLEAQQPIMKKLMRSDSAKKLVEKVSDLAKGFGYAGMKTEDSNLTQSVPFVAREIVETSRYMTREFLPPIFDESLLNELRAEYVDFQIVSQGGALEKREFLNEKHLELGLNISVIIRKMLEDRIMAFIPRVPPTKVEGGTHYSSNGLEQAAKVDYERVGAEIIRNNSWDELFLINLTKTQSFTYYLDKLYAKKL